MNPQYDHRDIVLEWYRTWWSKPIERGDVVTFRVNNGLYAKRIVGLPGEIVTLSGGAVFIGRNPQSPIRLEESYLSADIRNRTFKNTNNEDLTPVRYEVPAGHLFVLADDRQNGSDSRTFVEDHRMPTPYVPLSAIKSTLGRRIYSFGE